MTPTERFNPKNPHTEAAIFACAAQQNRATAIKNLRDFTQHPEIFDMMEFLPNAVFGEEIYIGGELAFSEEAWRTDPLCDRQSWLASILTVERERLKIGHVRMVCSQCGSEDVTRDVLARWDVDSQQWELSCELDNTDCNDCGGETSLVELPV